MLTTSDDARPYYAMKRDGDQQQSENIMRPKPPSDHYFMSIVQRKDEQVQQKMKGLVQERVLWNWISMTFLLIFAICAIVGKCLDPWPHRTNTSGASSELIHGLLIGAIVGLVAFFGSYFHLFRVQAKLDDFRAQILNPPPPPPNSVFV